MNGWRHADGYRLNYKNLKKHSYHGYRRHCLCIPVLGKLLEKCNKTTLYVTIKLKYSN